MTCLKRLIFRNQGVFLVDVIEHLSESEANLFMEKIKNQNKDEKIYLIIHTDNKNYLRFVRSRTDFIAVCLGENKYK